MQSRAKWLYEESIVWPMYPKNNPSYRVPALIRAPNNDLLVFAEKRLTTKGGDWGNFHIAMKRSTDKGNTWEPEEIVYERGPKDSTHC